MSDVGMSHQDRWTYFNPVTFVVLYIHENGNNTNPATGVQNVNDYTNHRRRRDPSHLSRGLLEAMRMPWGLPMRTLRRSSSSRDFPKREVHVGLHKMHAIRRH